MVHLAVCDDNFNELSNMGQLIIVKNNEGIQRILISHLVFAEVIGRYVLYHIRSGKVIECMDSFSSVCDNLLKVRSIYQAPPSFHR